MRDSQVLLISYIVVFSFDTRRQRNTQCVQLIVSVYSDDDVCVSFFALPISVDRRVQDDNTLAVVPLDTLHHISSTRNRSFPETSASCRRRQNFHWPVCNKHQPSFLNTHTSRDIKTINFDNTLGFPMFLWTHVV